MSKAYYPLSLEAVEDPEGYRPGGYHPVHLGDTYENGRYKVLHKLGAGGYSTTWLARDGNSERYVALKVVKASETASCAELKMLQRLAADESEHPGRAHVRSLLDHFTISGPNGEHCCLVSEVAGPTLLSLYDNAGPASARRLKGQIARKIARQVALAVAYLHANGVGHGDLTVPNILPKLNSIDAWTEEQIYERFGTPRTETLLTASKSAPGDCAPRYVVDAAKVPGAQHLTGEIFLIDLGVSFLFEAPPKPEDIGVPLMYRAPETIFDSRYDQFADLWSLGCLLFELRAGTPLFTRLMDTKDEIIRQWVQTKGKLPQPWWSRWSARSTYFDESGKPLPDGPDGFAMANEYPLQEMIADIGDEDGDVDSEGDTASEGEVAHSLLEVCGTRVPEDEAREMRDLLEAILQWIPEERMGIEQIIEHPWLSS